MIHMRTDPHKLTPTSNPHTRVSACTTCRTGPPGSSVSFSPLILWSSPRAGCSMQWDRGKTLRGKTLRGTDTQTVPTTSGHCGGSPTSGKREAAAWLLAVLPGLSNLTESYFSQL